MRFGGPGGAAREHLDGDAGARRRRSTRGALTVDGARVERVADQRSGGRARTSSQVVGLAGEGARSSEARSSRTRSRRAGG